MRAILSSPFFGPRTRSNALAYLSGRVSGISVVHPGKSVKSCESELLIPTFSVDEIQHLCTFIDR